MSFSLAGVCFGPKGRVIKGAGFNGRMMNDEHKFIISRNFPTPRQRKALSPAFSNAAVRKLTSVFYDSSYKVPKIISLLLPNFNRIT